MNRILIVQLLICLLTITTHAQKIAETWENEIEVISETEKFDGVVHHAYSTFVYEVTEDALRKLIIDEVKSSANGKVTKKNMIAALEVDIPHIGTDPIGVKAVTNSIMASHAIKVSVAFFHDSLEINPTDFPESDKAATEVMHEMGVMLNRSVVDVQIAGVEKEIANSNKKYESLKKEKAGFEKQIMNGEQKLAELDAHGLKLDAKLIDKQHKEERAKVLGESASADSKDAKKYAKAQKNVMSAERDILKTDQSKLKAQQNIDQGQKGLPLKEQEIAEIELQMNAQNELLAKLNVKYESIK
ncbi:MAG: hypothetical protein DRI69_08320 [Bacteroidetes bacterium]|nr:MAG: hypothetical protein DRI69_08320 [Bacteroidota bacterium]